MDLDPAAWVVHRHVVDPRLDELDLPAGTTDLGVRPIVPIDVPSHLWDFDTLALEKLARQTQSLLPADEVSSAG